MLGRQMTEQLDLGGTFTLPNTSITLNRTGYGAMQLAGQDGDKRVWGFPRDVPGAKCGTPVCLCADPTDV